MRNKILNVKSESDESNEIHLIMNGVYMIIKKALLNRKFFTQLPQNFMNTYAMGLKIDCTAVLLTYGISFDLIPFTNENIGKNKDNGNERAVLSKFKRIEKRIDKMIDRFQSQINYLTESCVNEISVGITSS